MVEPVTAGEVEYVEVARAETERGELAARLEETLDAAETARAASSTQLEEAVARAEAAERERVELTAGAEELAARAEALEAERAELAVQVERLSAFVNPSADIRGSTYNLDQSKTTIGSGGVLGKGLFEGKQTNLAYVPEQHTDFIFTAVGEELGFIGAAALLVLFAIVLWRTWRIAQLARDYYGTLVCGGVLAMFTFMIFENIGNETPNFRLQNSWISWSEPGSCPMKLLAGNPSTSNPRERYFS